MILVETDFELMTDAELRFTALRCEHLRQHTGDEEFGRLADEADEVLMRRMLAEPNPYEKGSERAGNN